MRDAAPPRSDIVDLVSGALARYREQCFDNVRYDVERLDAAMARRIASRLCARGGREGFMLGRRIIDAAKWL